jgi:DNA repair protein RecN (Recombination protein N)
MIQRLYIRNYALIDQLDLHFADGLTIITGETGAGKSILLGALGLIMGHRADNKTLLNEQEKCVVEGYFDIREYELHDFFKENDIDYDDNLVLRRELLPSGKSRGFINDTPVNLKLMQEICAELVDLHQQFDTLDIHDSSFQLKMLDALAENKDLLSQYRTIFRDFQSNQRKLEGLLQASGRAERESEFLRFQLKELDVAALQAEEQPILEEELRSLTHAEEIKRVTGAAFRQLAEQEMAVLGQLHEVGYALGPIGRYDQRVAVLYARLNSQALELQDIANELEQVAESAEYDPERIAQIQHRLDLIYRLQKKHGVNTIGELLDLMRDFERQLGGFSDLGAETEALKKAIEAQESSLKGLAAHLSERRKSVHEAFSRDIVGLLSQLAMEHAQLHIEFRHSPVLGPNGVDEVNFLFAANRGSRLLPIRDVASGGELSRLALVAKSLVASAIPLPTLIFDEIDAGVSGDVALKMGRILRRLSNEHQVVTITHSPQVASKADRHFFVYKRFDDEKTITRVKALDSAEEVRAIAVMLSQNPPSESAMENARELLKGKNN